MQSQPSATTPRSLHLVSKPDADKAMQRITAWFAGAMLDRPPIRFTAHNVEFNHGGHGTRRWPDLKSRWFDVEYQVEHFEQGIAGRQFLAETFPVFCPNLGPGVFAAFHGAPVEFGEVTSWTHPLVHAWSDVANVHLDRECPSFLAIEAMTRLALERCQDRYLVGYTDLHGGLDCVMDWRGSQQLCLDLIDAPECVDQLLAIAEAGFQPVYDHFNARLMAHGSCSVTWMGIPSYGSMHIPSCDFATMISPRQFDRFYLPYLQREVRKMTHNIFHLDGKGVARHLDRILAIPEIQAIQWVQGMGEDTPIMPWVPLIKKIQAAGKSVVVDIAPGELDGFMGAVRPEGIFLCIQAAADLQPAIIDRTLRWR